MILLVSNALQVCAKEWRGVVPLKSTRADVERLLGKPNQYGVYQFNDEKARIEYSDGTCTRHDYCQCLVPKDTVLSIFVLPERAIKFSEFVKDRSHYQRVKSHPDRPSVTYENKQDGVRYIVNEWRDEIDSIDFLPTLRDCQQLLLRQGSVQLTNQWRGLRPLFSSRSDVERLLGVPKSVGSIFIYDGVNESVEVRYATGNCALAYEKWNVPLDTVTSIEVTPSTTILVRDLRLDQAKYQRQKSLHPDNIIDYDNAEAGIIVHALRVDGCEQVLSFIYRPTAEDNTTKRCAR